MICSDKSREIMFKPCNHITSCNECATRCKKCLICKELIQERVRIEDCLICSEQKASVICMPCEHLCACESCAKLMKKCIVCRLQIEAHVSIKELYKTSEQNATENDPFKPNVEQDDVKKLQQQLQDIKEQVLKKLL